MGKNLYDRTSDVLTDMFDLVEQSAVKGKTPAQRKRITAWIAAQRKQADASFRSAYSEAKKYRKVL